MTISYKKILKSMLEKLHLLQPIYSYERFGLNHYSNFLASIAFKDKFDIKTLDKFNTQGKKKTCRKRKCGKSYKQFKK